MGKLEKQVEALQKELKKSESELQRLDAEKKLQSARVEQQRLIAIQARAAYQNGRQEYLKLLLNQQNPEKFARTLTYYDYLSQARLEQLKNFNETLRQLANVEKDIATSRRNCWCRKAASTAQRDELDKVRKERQQVLAKLNDDVKARDQKLPPASRTRPTWPKSSRPSKKPWPARPARRRSAAESADRPAGSGKSASVRPNWQPPATPRAT
jgi:septal ring factor EnvC (AmiA/AmiB activator)